MLATGASKTYRKVGESALDVTLHRGIDQGIDMLKEGGYFAILFKELNDGLVEAGKGLVALVLARIVHRTTVEHIATTVAGSVFGDAFLVGKTHYFNGEVSLLQAVGKPLQFGKRFQHFLQVRIFRIGLF